MALIRARCAFSPAAVCFPPHAADLSAAFSCAISRFLAQHFRGAERLRAAPVRRFAARFLCALGPLNLTQCRLAWPFAAQYFTQCRRVEAICNRMRGYNTST
jgi:hypothetical protein